MVYINIHYGWKYGLLKGYILRTVPNICIINWVCCSKPHRQNKLKSCLFIIHKMWYLYLDRSRNANYTCNLDFILCERKKKFFFCLFVCWLIFCFYFFLFLFIFSFLPILLSINGKIKNSRFDSHEPQYECMERYEFCSIWNRLSCFTIYVRESIGGCITSNGFTRELMNITWRLYQRTFAYIVK